MKKVTLFTLLLVLQFPSWACTVCKKQQPEVLRGFTHGAGPDSNWDYLILALAVVIVCATFILSIHFLVKPGEKQSNHIKYSILKSESA